ncbi:MAG: PAS domain S-box protein [Betaproteobacteria bacterium]|nr:PAS domain S-box protein [Betaproteobacteria bacterium]
MRNTSEEGSAKSSGQFQLLVEGAKDYAIFMLDADGRIANWNAGAAGLKGHEAEEIIGQHFSCFHTPEDIARGWPEQQLRRATAEGWAEDEGWRVRKDGSLFWANVMTTALRDPDGKLRGFSNVTRDLTCRKQAEAALRTSEERLWVFIDNAPVALAMFDREMRYMSASRRWISDYGMGRRDVRGLSQYEIFPEMSERWREILGRALAGETLRADMERFDRADGSVQWIRWEAQPWREPTGNIGGIVMFSEDVSDIRRGQESLRLSEERLAVIIGTAMDAIITLDENQRVVVFNSAAEKIFRCPASEVIGKPLDRFLPERFRESHHGHIKAFGATGVTKRSMHSPATIYGQRANGEEFPCEATISQASTGGQRLYTVILRDISERKKAEELADLYTKNKALDELKTKFFSNVHHELRTPLTLILGPIQKRLGAGGLTQELRRDLEVVERNARLLQRHINDLLDLSKLDAGRITAEYAEVDLARLAKIVAPYFELSAIEYGIAYTIDVPEFLPAEVDSAKIERILVNLLSNAFKFTPSGGKVRFGVRRSGDRAILEIEDSGPGIPVQLRETVFERFWQADIGAGHRYSRGAGLGLSIVKEFVGLHGGTIAVREPASGKGSLFTVELPLSAPSGTEVRRTADEPTMETARQAVEELEIRRTVQKSSEGPPAPGTAVVLVVEDNPDMNAFIAGTLAGRFRVFSAFGAQEGLEKALKLHPDLILSDILMPEMGGDQLVKEIRKHRELNDVPIVLLSVLTDAKLKVELLHDGAQDYLHKPFRPEELVAKVERIIADRRRAAEELRDMQQLSARLLEVRDRERKQVANELHENVAQYLAGLGMYLSSARNLGAAPSTEVQRFLDDGHTLLRQYYSDIRNMAGDLYPPVLDDFGLAAAIQLHVRGVKERHGIEVRLEVPSDLGRLPAEHELALFRVVEEALTNVWSHSGSKTATVRVFCDGSEIGLEVIDAGRGMSQPEGPTPGDNAKATGIREMRERVRNLGGRLEIASGAGGTTVRAVLTFVPRERASPRY